MTTIDDSLAFSVFAVLMQTSALFIAIVTVVTIVPIFILPGLMFSFVFYRISLGYLRCSRELRRLDSNSRSPIFTAFSDLLDGVVTVRAFSAERRFFENAVKQIDTATQYTYTTWSVRP